MKQPKVTFYMMAYNTEKYIEKAVRSVLNQTEPDVNIYIRNNGSTDKTGEILKKLQKEDRRVNVITNEVNGKGKNGEVPFQKEWWFNDDQIIGEYISILDSDDWLEPDFVESLYSVAKKNNSQIVAAGCNYCNEFGSVLGNRLPQKAENVTLAFFKDEFPHVYNVFRTWWGKLFEKDFFLENYEACWVLETPIWFSSPYGNIDTCIMMSYLERCENLSCIDKPLYNFLINSKSTYNNRPLDFGIFTAADSLYVHAIKNLKKFDILTPANLDFIERCNWSFILEAISGIEIRDDVTAGEKYSFLQYAFTYEAANAMFSNKKTYMLSSIKGVLDSLERRYKNTENIYNYYIARINAFENMLLNGTMSSIATVVGLSVLCDVNNKNLLGQQLFILKMKEFDFLETTKKLFEIHSEQRKWLFTFPAKLVEFFRINELDDSIREDEKELKVFWSKMDIGNIIKTSCKILNKNPLNLLGIICMINCFYAQGINDMGDLLNESILFIWSASEIEAIIEELNSLGS